ncbi:nicotinamide-nucleotide amidohydrolase family protein [Mesorhizobium sp. NBSH29]|uniref:CinA family protein n=1 Tax=Mesorhizobium sp. NBSH29 TaxID=2654249 RepID=UPI0018966F36|nr:CinA family protein [Mesorhizobium sp. NBSH29]QPC87757.1 nicotinamide-nucleotide amidohydrolase family protein [Mesorhizobium sp. NBSH29]
MNDLQQLANQFLQACAERNILVATAESCTGGMIMALLTDIPGSSAMVDRGFVTYSNNAKMEMLDVAQETLDTYGAVSREAALEMAAGALARSNAGIALSVTGIAGPDGGTVEKPVGLVWFGIAVEGHPPRTESRAFPNLGRDYIRRETVRIALELGLAALQED